MASHNLYHETTLYEYVVVLSSVACGPKCYIHRSKLTVGWQLVKVHVSFRLLVVNSSQLFQPLATKPSPPHNSSCGTQISLVSVTRRPSSMCARAPLAVRLSRRQRTSRLAAGTGGMYCRSHRDLAGVLFSRRESRTNAQAPSNFNVVQALRLHQNSQLCKVTPLRIRSMAAAAMRGFVRWHAKISLATFHVLILPTSRFLVAAKFRVEL